jgi:WD40 repeat protein
MRHFLRASLLGLLVLPVLPARGADGDELPKGAKVRLGDTQLLLRLGGVAPTPFPPDYKTFAMRDERGELRFIDMESGKPVGKALDDRAVGGFGGQLIVSGDGKRYVIVGGLNAIVRDVATGDNVRAFERPRQPGVPGVTGLSSASLSADGKVLAVGGQDKDRQGDVTVWDVDKNEVLFEAKTIFPSPALPVLSADGKLVAVHGFRPGLPVGPGPKKDNEPARTVQVWEIATKKEVLRAKLSLPSNIIGVVGVALSPDGSLLAASAGNGVIDWWDVKTGKANQQLLGRANQGHHLVFSPDGKTLASIGMDSAIQRWRMPEGKPLPSTPFPSGPAPFSARGLRFLDNERVLTWGSVGSRVAVWEAPAGKLLTPLPQHTATIRSIAFAESGKEIITSALDDRTVRWDAATGKPIGRVIVKPNNSPSANPVLMLSVDGTLGMTFTIPPTLYDLKTGVEEFTLPPSPATQRASLTTANTDLTRVVLTNFSLDQNPSTCVVWDLVARQKLGEVKLDPSIRYLSGIGVSPSGKHMVTAHPVPFKPVGNEVGEKLRITGWDVKTGKKLGEVEDIFARGEPNLTVVGDSHAIVTAANGRVRAYDYETGKGDIVFEEGENAGLTTRRPVVLSPDGKRFAVGWADRPAKAYGARVYEWPSGKVLHTLTGHAAPVSALRFSPDGKTLATGSEDATVLLWDVSEAK